MRPGYHEQPRTDIQALVQAPGARILDVGCGSGTLAAAFKEAGASHVAGVEIDSGAAAMARAALDVVVEGGAMEAELPFSPGEFDYLVFGDVLEHLPEPEAALARYLEYLSANGRVIVSVPNMRFYTVLLRLLFDRWSYTDVGVRDRTHLRIFTRRSLERMLTDAGLEIETLARNFRLFEDQSGIGRMGALATRVVRRTLGPWLLRDLLAYQYLAVCRLRPRVPTSERP
jgi:2-polyprenyl-3-methyl-5-hydroxy-6-metoxy-1,4-benzoquinol methylase